MGEVAALLARYIGNGPDRISQREAARRTGVRQQTIGLILRGRTLLPEDATMDRLTGGLGLDQDEVAAALARDRAKSFVLFKGSDRVQTALEAAAELTPAERHEYLANLRAIMDDQTNNDHDT